MTKKICVPVYTYTANDLNCEVVIMPFGYDHHDVVKVWTPFGVHYVERAALRESPLWREFDREVLA